MSPCLENSRSLNVSRPWSVVKVMFKRLLERKLKATTQLAMGLAACSMLSALAGCGGPKAEFRRYTTFAHKVADSAGLPKGFTRDQLQGVDEVMQALFGTPDEPLLPAVEGVELGKIVNASHLKIA